MSEPNDVVDRREFIRGLLRKAAVAGLALAGGALAAKSLNAPAAPEKPCVNQGVCRGCGSFPQCGLPQALSLRDSLKKQ